MTNYARWQSTITDDEGNVQPGASVEVRLESIGAPLATLYSDRTGLAPIGNPVTADADGFVYFHVTGGAYKITASFDGETRIWRYVPIGLGAETDFVLAGTANYLAKYSSSIALGVSIIFDDGTYVGIGTTSPGAKLHVVDGYVRIESSGATDYGVQLKNSSGTLGILAIGDSVDATNAHGVFIETNAGRTFGITTGGVGYFGPAGWATASQLTVGKTSQTDNTNSALFVADGTTITKGVAIGYNAASDYGYIQAVNRAIVYKNLILQAEGGKIGIGLAAGVASTWVAGTVTPQVQNHGASLDASSVGFARYTNDANGAGLYLAKSRHATNGSHTIVTSGDTLGSVNFLGSDGTNFIAASQIRGESDGTPGASNDMPGRLTFWTTPDGSGTLAERMRIDSSGFVGIGTTPDSIISILQGTNDPSILRIAGNAGLELRRANGTAGSKTAVVNNNQLGENSFRGYDGASYIKSSSFSGDVEGTVSTGIVPGRFSINTMTTAGVLTERIRFDSAGRVVIGLAAAAVGKFASGAITPFMQTHAAVGNGSWSSYSADALGSNLYLTKSRHATVGSHTIVQSSDALGVINFGGSDGTNFVTAAQILSAVDGTPGASNDMPGRLVFLTTPDGSGTLAERARIDNVGNVKIGGTAARGTTESQGALCLFNAAQAPVGTLSNGVSLYSASGVFKAMDAAGTVISLDTHLLRDDTSATLAKGFYETPYSNGTVSSGTLTPDAGNNNLQYYTNNGAHTLAPPSAASSILMEITNGASAGAITTSGFTKVTGDAFTTTNAHKFLCTIVKSQTYSLLNVVALQ